MYLIVQYISIRVINLFLFYRSADDFVNRQIVRSSDRQFVNSSVRRCLPALFSIHNLYLRPSSALTHFNLFSIYIGL